MTPPTPPKPPPSSGCTSSSTSPAPAAGSTIPAALSSSPDDGWLRADTGEIRRGPYRILKWYIGRAHQPPAPVYQAFHRFAFLGTFPRAEDACAHCAQHEARHA